MNLYDNAHAIAIEVLAQKWNRTVAHDELRDSHTKINSIVMGTSKVFSFDIYLPSGRVHKFNVSEGKIEHRIVQT
jgi:hypothetical protein